MGIAFHPEAICRLSQYRFQTISANLLYHRPPTEKDCPSYARSTRASLLRQSTSPSTSSGTSTPATSVSSSSPSPDAIKQAPQRVIFEGTAYTYNNGKLLPSNPGYLRATYATINKFGGREHQRETDYLVSRPPPLGSWGYPRTKALSGSTDWCNEVLLNQQQVKVMSQGELEDRFARAQLAIRTRLYDNAWISERNNNVCLDHDETRGILDTAEDLAKWCLYRWLCTHHPETCRRRNLLYFSDLDFGRDSLSQFFWNTIFDYRSTKRTEVIQVLENLIWLRNTVHHFNGWSCSLENVEMHLSNVQRLAVLLYDEEIARTARALRDRLRGKAEEVAREIETVGLLTTLPFAGDLSWNIHHVQLFLQISQEPGDEESSRRKYSAAAVDGAMEFAEGNPDLTWNLEPKLDASLAKVGRLATAGGASDYQWDSYIRKGRISREAHPNRWRSSSSNGPRRVLGKPARAQGAARRGSFSVWEEDGLML